jgi:hypothetical protein
MGKAFSVAVPFEAKGSFFRYEVAIKGCTYTGAPACPGKAIFEIQIAKAGMSLGIKQISEIGGLGQSWNVP